MTSSRPAVRSGLLQLISSWPLTPALIYDRYQTVLAVNPLAHTLSPLFHPGHNALRDLFLDDAIADSLHDWDRAASNAVAALRAVSGNAEADTQLLHLIGDLSLRSQPFRNIWARADMVRSPGGRLGLEVSGIGPIELHYERFTLPDSTSLVAFCANPHSASEDALRLLGSITADRS